MFAVIGAAGLWGIQHLAHTRDEQQRQSADATKTATPSARNANSILSSSDRPSASLDSNRSSYQQQQQHGRAFTARDGVFVCFKDRTGQVAVIQPYGNGGSWQLTVTCASGGCCMLPEGELALQPKAVGSVLVKGWLGGW